MAPSRLPVVTRRLTDLASRGEQRVLSRARYCVGGLAATASRISTEAKTSSQDVALMAVCPSIRDLLFCGSQVGLRRSTNDAFRVPESSDSNSSFLQAPRRADLQTPLDSDDMPDSG